MKISSRFTVLQAFIHICLIALLGCLFLNQVFLGGIYRKSSEKNRIRLIRLEAPRGNIYDRNGVVLAGNRPAYNVYVIPEDFKSRDVPELTKLLGLSESDIHKRLGQLRSASFTPSLLKADVPKELAMSLEERRPRLAGVFIQTSAIRTYPLGETAAHIVGYIGKITKQEYERLDHDLYFNDSWMGRSGIEKAYDSRLRGEDGGRQLEVNARGVPIRILSERAPRVGSDIHLTIDSRFDAQLKPLLLGHRGSVIIMNLKTGQIITAVSLPAFDPNAFVAPNRSNERMELIGSKGRPLLNRGFNGLYPPGSVFKLVTALAALESGVISPQTTFECRGYFRFGKKSRPFKCWFPGGHGRVDLYRALERSCNVYFYNVGRLVGEKRISEYARRLGFGSTVLFELPTEGGIVPDAQWKLKNRQGDWFGGDTVMLAIGQSYLLVTPFQIVRLVSAVALDGHIIQPKIVLSDANQVEAPKYMHTNKAAFEAIKQGMLKVVQSDKGTGQLARVDFGKFAAKTGTAQAPPGLPHAWFSGFFPYENPEIAIVVFVERGKSGGLISARIAKQAVSMWRQWNVPQAA